MIESTTQKKPTWKEISKNTTWAISNTNAVGSDTRIVITNNHINYKPTWVMHCYKLNMHCVPLKSTNKEDAKKEAVLLVAERLQNHIKQLMTFL